MSPGRPEDAVAPYLRPGPAQERLATKMAAGHAREGHGSDLGDLSETAFRSLALRHLTRGDTVHRMDPTNARPGTEAKPCYLVTDSRSGLIAWIPPHTEEMATLFRPDEGVRAFTARKRALALGKGHRWTQLDARALRRPGAGRIQSTDRHRPPPGRER